MSTEGWLPRGFEISAGTTLRKRVSGADSWEIYQASGDCSALVACDTLFQKWVDGGLIDSGLFLDADYQSSRYHIFVSKPSYMISSVQYGPYPKDSTAGRAFAQAMKQIRAKIADVSLHDGIYIEQISLFLPTYTLTEAQDDRTVLGTWLSGGVHISTQSFRRLCTLLNWMPPGEVAQIALDAGLPVENTDTALQGASSQEKTGKRRDGEVSQHFSLPGRIKLETFFNDHIVDIIRNEEQYRRLGIEFPSAVILHGPPGCGKTYAVERLIEFLDWPSYSINSGSIGSPFIHDTSKKISEIFETAIQNAPSVLVIDEMEAFLSERGFGQSSGTHHVEEVAEFLRRIPEATKNHVLVIAMTNMIDTIDEAILRRGRFDHILEVEMPSKEEVTASLSSLLGRLPVMDDVEIDALADKLKGHPMSDVAFVVKEGGRIAAKNGKECIDNASLEAALQSLPEGKSTKRTIGFAAGDNN